LAVLPSTDANDAASTDLLSARQQADAAVWNASRNDELKFEGFLKFSFPLLRKELFVLQKTMKTKNHEIEISKNQAQDDTSKDEPGQMHVCIKVPVYVQFVMGEFSEFPVSKLVLKDQCVRLMVLVTTCAQDTYDERCRKAALAVEDAVRLVSIHHP
jgi:hypothetical protein